MYCKLPTNGKQLPAFPVEALWGSNPGLRCGRREGYHSATMAPLCLVELFFKALFNSFFQSLYNQSLKLVQPIWQTITRNLFSLQQLAVLPHQLAIIPTFPADHVPSPAIPQQQFVSSVASSTQTLQHPQPVLQVGHSKTPYSRFVYQTHSYTSSAKG